MSTLQTTTIAGLQDALDLSIHQAFAALPAQRQIDFTANGVSWSDRRAATDIISAEIVRYCAKHDVKTDADRERMMRRVSKRAGKQTVQSQSPRGQACGFVFVPILILIGEAFFTWICEELFSKWWGDWFKSTPNAKEVCKTMAVGLGEFVDSEDSDEEG